MSLSTANKETTRQIESELLSRIAEAGQLNVASALRIESSTISKWKAEGKLAQLAELLAVLDLKLVPSDAVIACPGDVVVSAEELGAMETLAAKYLGAKRGTQILISEASLWQRFHFWMARMWNRWVAA